MSFPSHSRLRKSDSTYCGHCGQYLSRSAFWKHRKAFYDATNGSWTTKENLVSEKCKRAKYSASSNNRSTSSVEVASPCQTSSSEDEDIETAEFTQAHLLVGDNDFQGLLFDDDRQEENEETSSADENSNSDGYSVTSNDETYDERADESSSCTDDDEEPDIWNGRENDVFRDLDNHHNPLPEPSQSHSTIQALTSLVQWFVYFILLWQTVCKISDSGLEWLLQFMSQFFRLLGITCNSEHLSQMALLFPSSLYLLRKFVALDRDDFSKLAVCPKCATLYPLDHCTTRVGDRIVSSTCTNKKFRKGRSKECGASLSRKVILNDGKECFYPYKLYCFNSVINQLEAILKRPGLPEMCEQWRERIYEENVMADVYDGLIWKDFLQYEEKEFLNAQRNLAFAINVDWFQPFKRRKDRSVGVIYLVILNLPREERYKWENVMVASIIPEMSKEPKSLNTFLQPIVDELKVLWKGVRLKTSLSRVELTYRAAILFASADLPAVRKLCGFKGFSAHRGCSKCFKFFPSSFGQKTDYSGFDRTQWPPRRNCTHRKHAALVRQASTQTTHEALAKKYGVYYSCLLQLDYFDVVRFTAIDPMHNLFLGTAKHIFKLWIKTEVLNKKDLHTLEERIHSVDVGTGIGRLPHRIASNYGSYTAAQWKNWTLIYSMYCLNGLLPEAHLRCWQTFVLACQYLSAPVLTKSDIIKADLLFVKFGERFERLFGKKAVTPNMHLHCHLKECIYDLGPIHAFWCFSFERFNGILGATQVNGRSIEVQLMRKLLVGRFVWNVEFPHEFEDSFLLFFNHKNGNGDVENFSARTAMQLLNSSRANSLQDFSWSDLTFVELPTSHKHIALGRDEMSLLLGCYQTLYPAHQISMSCLQSVARKLAYVLLGGEKFGSKMDCRSLRSARVMASWVGAEGCIDSSAEERPGSVNFYILHSVKINNEIHQHVLACMWWYKTDCDKDFYGKPVQVWQANEYENCGPATFMPVQRIAQTFAASSVEREGTKKLIVNPIPRTFH